MALAGDFAVVGAFGDDSSSRQINGDQADNTFPNAGSAFVFKRVGTAWYQRDYVKASNADSNDSFGYTLALSGSLLVVGAAGEDSNATGIDGTQANNDASSLGASYVFDLSAPELAIKSHLKRGLSHEMEFVYAEALSGWKVKGSHDLNSFPDDLTSVSTIVEISPGLNKAVVDVSGAPVDRYFLRIER